MSVPYSINKVAGADKQPTASQKVPLIARPYVSEKALKMLDIVGYIGFLYAQLKQVRS